MGAHALWSTREPSRQVSAPCTERRLLRAYFVTIRCLRKCNRMLWLSFARLEFQNNEIGGENELTHFWSAPEWLWQVRPTGGEKRSARECFATIRCLRKCNRMLWLSFARLELQNNEIGGENELTHFWSAPKWSWQSRPLGGERPRGAV